MTIRFWKTFGIVFVVAIAANVGVAWIFGRVFPDSSWSWGTTITSAVIIAIAAAMLSWRNISGGMDKANQARTQERKEALERVMALFGTKSEITNNDVQSALGVSDATATNYLSALEAQGRIRQIGETGRPVRYIKNG